MTFFDFSPASILVVGDVMLDAYIHGQTDRISPEAPVPVLREQYSRFVPGGAANVALNAAALGARVTLVAAVGDDAEAAQLDALLEEAGVVFRKVVDPSRPTTVKTRIMAGSHQIVRVDRESTDGVTGDATEALLRHVHEMMPDCGALVISDYAKGCLGHEALRRAIACARDHDRPVLVDPKRADLSVYAGATLIKPNRAELHAATGLPCNTDDEVEAAAAVALRQGIGTLLLTRAERGMSLFAGGRPPLHMPTRMREVFDVSGAGDTVIATLALAIATGSTIEQAMRLANHAAGIVVAKPGTASLTPRELRTSLAEDGDDGGGSGRLASWDDALAFRRTCQSLGLSVGFTNGCFDLVHPGHVRLLQQAAQHCDRLVVGLNSDLSVRRLKGAGRPIQTEADRAAVIGSIRGVALVVLFEEDTPEQLIDRLEPDLLVKGADYAEDAIVGGAAVKARGGRVLRVELLEGRSTTMLDRRRQETDAT